MANSVPSLCFLALCLATVYGFGENGALRITPSDAFHLVKVGASQELVCETKAQEEIIWDLSDINAESKRLIERKMVYEGDIQKQRLTIESFTTEMKGSYVCKFLNVPTDTPDVKQTITLVPVEEIKTEATYRQGNSTAELACRLEGPETRVTKVEWLKDDQLLDNQEGSRFQVNSAKNTLVITNPKPSDIGNYTARIQLATIDKPYDCVVAFSEAEVETVSKVEPVFHKDNDTAVLACNINTSGREIKSLQWLKNNTRVTERKEGDRFAEFKKNSSLVISEPTPMDAGLYTARFEIVGRQGPFDCNVMFKAPPKVLAFKKAKNLIEKDNTELQCMVQGFPPSVVTWFKDGKPLNVSSDDDRVKLEPFRGYRNARLIINDVEFSDAGEYECEAYSKFFNQSDRQDITVRVKDKLAALWPFLGIVCEVVVLCTIIFCYEKRRNKQIEQDEQNAQEADGPAPEKKDGLRHRNAAGNPSA